MAVIQKTIRLEGRKKSESAAATLEKWRMKLDFEHDEVIIDPRVTHLRLLFQKPAETDALWERGMP
jgi:hypothetical protein